MVRAASAEHGFTTSGVARRLRRGPSARLAGSRPPRRAAGRTTPRVVDATDGRDPLSRQQRQLGGQRRERLGAVPGRVEGGTQHTRRPHAVPERRARPTCRVRTRTRGRTSTTTTPTRSRRPHRAARHPDAGEAVARAARAATSSSRSPTSRRPTRRRVRRRAQVLVELRHHDELADQPRAERGPGVLLRQPLPRPPARGADLVHRRRRHFDGGDRVLVKTDDGAAPTGGGRTTTTSTTRTCTRRPTARRPTMQMYLFSATSRLPRRQRRRRRVDRLPRVHARARRTGS